MKVPTALFSGGQDTLADPKDMAVLLTQVSTHASGNRNGENRLKCLMAHLSLPSSLSTGPPVYPQVSHLVFHQHIEHWEHLDFIWGLDATDVMFPSILKLLRQYS